MIDSTTQAECEAKCTEKSDCKYYSYVDKDSDSYHKGYCYLFSADNCHITYGLESRDSSAKQVKDYGMTLMKR